MGYWDYCLAKAGLLSGLVAGCDVYNDFRIEELRSIGTGLEVEYGTMADGRIPFIDGKFDLTFSMDVIEHVENDCRLVKEHIRVTRTGGTVLIGTPNRWRIANIGLLMTRKLSYPRYMGRQSYGEAFHLREYTFGELNQLTASYRESIRPGSLRIVACWFGTAVSNLGLKRFPAFLAPICQFWFVLFEKS